MPSTINRQQLQELLDKKGVQLVDVLPELEYSRSHIPGAINVPLKKLDAEAVANLDRGMPVAVY